MKLTISTSSLLVDYSSKPRPLTSSVIYICLMSPTIRCNTKGHLRKDCKSEVAVKSKKRKGKRKAKEENSADKTVDF